MFFSHCNMRCLYCQNYRWSQQHEGKPLRETQLVSLLESLYAGGCHNWNLVTPAPWLPHIETALDTLRGRDIRLPVVYNTSGYESVTTLAAADEWTDIYLTDLRYADPVTAAEGSQAADYVSVAREALLHMWRRKGTLETDDGDIALRGVICRILVLPGRAGEALANLHWLAHHAGTEIAVSLMAQYTPAWQARDRSGWDRSLTEEEYRQVSDGMEELGFTNGWIQDVGAASAPPLLGYNMQAAAPPPELAAG